MKPRMEARQAPASGYSDLDEGLERLEIEGLLIRIKEPVDKDQEMHPFVRWQFRGGIKEKDPKAFLFEKPVDRERFTRMSGVFMISLGTIRTRLTPRWLVFLT